MQKLFLILILNINSGLKNDDPPVLLTAQCCGAATTAIEDELIYKPKSISFTDPAIEIGSASSPCSPQSVANGQFITNFCHTTGYEQGFGSLVKANVSGVGTEFAIVFGINYTTGIPTATPMITNLSENSVTINANPPNILVTAIAHTHHDKVFPAPSAGDIYAFGNYAQYHPDFLYYILASDGSKYVLTVTNPDSLSAFLKLYPQRTNIAADGNGNAGRGAGYNPGSALYLAMQKAANSILSKCAEPDNPGAADLDAAHEAVQVFILDHFNTGITLFKQGADGNFHELHSELNEEKLIRKVLACK